MCPQGGRAPIAGPLFQFSRYPQSSDPTRLILPRPRRYGYLSHACPIPGVQHLQRNLLLSSLSLHPRPSISAPVSVPSSAVATGCSSEDPGCHSEDPGRSPEGSVGPPKVLGTKPRNKNLLGEGCTLSTCHVKLTYIVILSIVYYPRFIALGLLSSVLRTAILRYPVPVLRS